MARRTYSKTELGMLFGIFVGGGLGTVLFVSTGDPLYIALTGVGLVIGLIHWSWHGQTPVWKGRLTQGCRRAQTVTSFRFTSRHLVVTCQRAF